MENDLKKFTTADDKDIVAGAPAPVAKPLAAAHNWMDNQSYPLVKPQHAEELEQAAAINEFGSKKPRAEAEAEAYDGYKKRQHTEAAAHHLSGMKAAHGAGDMEAARKHSLMYDLHSKAIGHEPIGPAHPDVIAHLNGSPAKVYKFKPHHGDQLALSGVTPAAPSEPAAAPPAAMGKSEVGALNVLHTACQALLKSNGNWAELTPMGQKKGCQHDAKGTGNACGDKASLSHPTSGKRFCLKHAKVHGYKAPEPTEKAEGSVQAAKLTVTDKFHGAGKQLGPTVQVDKGKHTSNPPRPRPRTEPNYAKKGEMAESLDKVAPPGFSEKTMHGLKAKHGVESAFKIAWSAYEKGKHKKAEVSFVKSKAAPCVCTSYSFPHRHKSGKCGAGK